MYKFKCTNNKIELILGSAQELKDGWKIFIDGHEMHLRCGVSCPDEGKQVQYNRLYLYNSGKLIHLNINVTTLSGEIISSSKKQLVTNQCIRVGDFIYQDYILSLFFS